MGVSSNDGTQQLLVSLLKNDHFGVFWGYHYFRKHPYNIYYKSQTLNVWYESIVIPTFTMKKHHHHCGVNIPYMSVYLIDIASLKTSNSTLPIGKWATRHGRDFRSSVDFLVVLPSLPGEAKWSPCLTREKVPPEDAEA